MTSIKQVNTWIDDTPDFVNTKLNDAWAEISAFYQSSEAPASNDWSKEDCPWSVSFLQDLIAIWSRSDFVRDSCVRYPLWLSDLASKDTILDRQRTVSEYHQALVVQCLSVSEEPSFMTAIRKFRRMEMLRIIWRDLLNKVSLDETLSDVSSLADVCVSVALDFAYQELSVKYGVPMSRGDNPQAQKMLILAMGKHGAKELNVSSDIDLILAYPHAGETEGTDKNVPVKSIDNHLFFTRLGQKLIQLLDQVTRDGFVFRVDMRLRPYGDSGSLALNFSAFEDYYSHQGREWERFAMIKARIVNDLDDQDESARLMAIIRPFVYRKYTDFSSIQALRDMKRLINSEVHRKGGDQNIKLGRGGIREVEFIAQACQLIYGGRDDQLQQTGLMSVYDTLKSQQYLPDDWVVPLVEGYRFLRNLEHAIQGLADQQTQLIPDADSDKQRIAWSVGSLKTTWAEIELKLNTHRQVIHTFFEQFLSEQTLENVADNHASSNHWLDLWQVEASEQEWVAALSKVSFGNPEQSYRQLSALRENRLFILMSDEARRRFEYFLPRLIEAVSETPLPSVTLDRVLGLVRVILGRTVYLVLLYENPTALKQLCHLCSCSPWVAEHLAKNPVILDELLDTTSLYHPPEKAALKDELRQQLLRIPEDDLESQMTCLRTFRHSHMLRVAAAELGGYLPLMKVSDYLTWLAEVILEQSMNIAWGNLVHKHGLPSGADVNVSANAKTRSLSTEALSENKESSCKGFAVIGYGKLGGIELAYSSDLDLVFLYDGDGQGMTSGQRPIDNQVFYLRLGQRIIHILSAQTPQGRLYEIDMRLRPSGNSGMLVSSLNAFEKYQKHDAWTWEHQALVRARGIAGDHELIENFNLVRRSVLTQCRDSVALKADVLSMRLKMKETAHSDDLKLGDGGLVDIEFITQFGVLRHAHAQTSLLVHSDNIRILEDLARTCCFGEIDISPLVSGYRTLRSALHRKSLAAASDPVETLRDYPAVRSQVQIIWRQIFSDSNDNF